MQYASQNIGLGRNWDRRATAGTHLIPIRTEPKAPGGLRQGTPRMLAQKEVSACAVDRDEHAMEDQQAADEPASRSLALSAAHGSSPTSQSTGRCQSLQWLFRASDSASHWHTCSGLVDAWHGLLTSGGFIKINSEYWQQQSWSCPPRTASAIKQAERWSELS